MKSSKKIFVVLCILAILGTIPSIYFILTALIEGNVIDAEKQYFVNKLLFYIFEVLVVLFILFKLIQKKRNL